MRLRFAGSFFLLLAGLLVLEVIITPLPAAMPRFIMADVPTYFTAMLQSDDPQLFARDPLYGGGKLSHTFNWSSWGYLRLLQVVFFLTGENTVLTLFAVNAILFSVGVIGMALLLTCFLRSATVVTMLAFISMGLTTTSLGPVVWGFPINSLSFYQYFPLPSVIADFMFIATAPWLLWACLQGWWLPALQGKPLSLARVFSVGILVGLTPFLISSTGALGLILFLGLLTLLGIVCQCLSWASGAVFVAGVVPLLVLRLITGVGLATNITPESAQLLVSLSDAMIFPWTTGTPDELLRQQQLLSIGLAIYGVLTGASTLLAWRTQQMAWKLLLLWTQVGLLIAVLETSGLSWFVGIYGTWRVLMRRDDMLDRALLAALPAGVLAGYGSQMVLYMIWQITHLPGLVAFLFEAARFSRYIIIVVYLILARAVVIFGEAVPLRRGQLPIMVVLCLLILLNNNAYGAAEISAGIALVLAAISLIVMPYLQKHWHAPALVLLVIISLGLAIAMHFSQQVRIMQWQQVAREQEIVDRDYAAAAAWARENTSADSLFHLVEMNNSFRVLAHRSLLIGQVDINRTVYSDLDTFTMQHMLISADIAKVGGSVLTGFVAHYDVDYVLIPTTTPPLYPGMFENVWYLPTIVYQNTHYRIEHIEKAAWLFDKPVPLTAPFVAEQQSFVLDFPLATDTLVLNPMPGDIFNYEGIENWLPAYALQYGANSKITFTLTHLIQHMRYVDELSFSVAQAWHRNYLPGDLKAAKIGYVLLTSNWLKQLGAYTQSLFADSSQYNIVATLVSPLDNVEYQLYAVVGDTTETHRPVALDNNLPILPPYAHPEDAIIIAAPTVWRGAVVQAAFLPDVVPLFSIAMPEPTEKKLLVLPENTVYEIDKTSFDKLNTFIAGRERIWYADVNRTEYPMPIFKYLQEQGYIFDGGRQATIVDFPHLPVTLYQVQRPPVALATQWVFGNHELALQAIERLAADVIQPCTAIGFRTWWQQMAIPAQNYFVTLRLITPDGKLITQSDGRLGEHRLIDLPANTILFDERWLTLPCEIPPGNYVIQLGLYSYENGTYSDLLPTYDTNEMPAGGMITLDALNITP